MYEQFASFSNFLKNKPIYISSTRDDGSIVYSYNPEVLEEYRKFFQSVVNSPRKVREYSLEEKTRAKAIIGQQMLQLKSDKTSKDYLESAFEQDIIGGGSFSDKKLLTSSRGEQYRSFLLKEYFGSYEDFLRMSDDEIASRYFQMLENL